MIEIMDGATVGHGGKGPMGSLGCPLRRNLNFTVATDLSDALYLILTSREDLCLQCSIAVHPIRFEGVLSVSFITFMQALFTQDLIMLERYKHTCIITVGLCFLRLLFRCQRLCKSEGALVNTLCNLYYTKGCYR